MNVKRQKILATVAMVALLVGIGFYAGMQHRQSIYLSEDMDFNKEPVLSGHLTMTKIDANGIRFLMWSEHNVITNDGRLDICDYIGGTAGASFDYIAIGTGSAGGAGSSTLVTEVFRAQGTFAEPVAYNWTITYTWPATTFSGEIITEAGVLNAASTGTLLNYQDFDGITLSASDSLEVEFEFMVTSG